MRNKFIYSLMLSAVLGIGHADVYKGKEDIKPDGVKDIYREFNIGKGKTVYLEELHPRREGIMPFYWIPYRNNMVKPEGPNYWYYFNRDPCRGEYAKVWEGVPDEQNLCKYKYNTEDKEHTPKGIPEPTQLFMLGTGLISLYLYQAHRLLRKKKQ